MREAAQVEVCCLCGLVIRDDVAGDRANALHYHWADKYEFDAGAIGPVVASPTVCAQHVGGSDWARMWAMARSVTDTSYLKKGSWNAGLDISRLDAALAKRLRSAWHALQAAIVEVYQHGRRAPEKDEP